MKKLFILIVCSLIAISAAGQDLKPKQGENGKWGLINDKNVWHIKNKFEGAKTGNYIDPGYAVKQRGKWGYVNFYEKPIIDFIYDDASSFSRINNKYIAKVKKYNKWGLIDESGTQIAPCIYDNIGYLREYTKAQINGKWGVIDYLGHTLITCKYDEIGNYSNNRIKVRNNGKYGYIDYSGKQIVPCIYDELTGPYYNDYYKARKNDKWGYIDIYGHIVIDCLYDEIGIYSTAKPIKVKIKDKYGYIDNKGNILLDCIYDNILSYNDTKKTARVELNGNVGDIVIKDSKSGINSDTTTNPYSSFSKYAKNYVEVRINEWQKKGEFEKTIDWKKRVNEQTRNQKIRELTKNAEKQFISEQSKKIKFTYYLGQYDADNEVYLVKYYDRNMLVPVPISEAPAFKSSWSSIVKTPKFFIENDRLSVAEVTFRMPNGKTYKYSNAASLNYTVAQVDYNFDPIELDLPIGTSRPAGQQNISTVNVSVGKADVDTDIPQCNKTNDRTFAVIIANENYSKLAKVPFALNDGKTFGEYCRRTLGLPQSNIRFYGDATYGTMLAAVNDIGKIAAAYDGDIRVIFYYAGHGAPNESTQEAFLMPVDAYGVGTEACYSLDRLYNELGALGAKNVTVFLDACFSGSTRDGAMLASARGVAIKPKAVSPHGNMVVFSAASADETALPYNDKGHGLFTYFLLKKLQLSEGDVTFGELGDYITEQVRQKSTVVNRKSQTPTVTVAPTLAQTWKTMCF